MLHVADEGLIRLEPASSLAPPALFAISAGLRIVDFDEDRVVFDPLSWDAHLLNPAASAVLDLFLQGPQSVDEVADFLADALDPRERSDADKHARQLITDLHSLGLVHHVGEDARAHR